MARKKAKVTKPAEPEACNACGRAYAFERDDEGRALPYLGLFPACDETCGTCDGCGLRFRHDSDDPVCFAPNDDTGARFGESVRCAKCWEKAGA